MKKTSGCFVIVFPTNEVINVRCDVRATGKSNFTFTFQGIYCRQLKFAFNYPQNPLTGRRRLVISPVSQVFTIPSDFIILIYNYCKFPSLGRLLCGLFLCSNNITGFNKRYLEVTGDVLKTRTLHECTVLYINCYLIKHITFLISRKSSTFFASSSFN